MDESWRPSEKDIVRFVKQEAHLADSGQYDAWFELFAPDGHYWIPLADHQSDPVTQQSLLYEDAILLEVRVQRFRHPQIHSNRPAARCQHVLQEPEIELCDSASGMYHVRTPFIYLEQRGEHQLLLGGTARHHLRAREGKLRIVLKRVDLINAGAGLPGIFLFP